MGKLTISKEHYLKAIYELERSGDGARISDIADKLDVAKSSVCAAMDSLQQIKLIDRDADRKVLLTCAGKVEAEFIINKFSIVKRFLIEVFELDEEKADIDACSLEHVISVETFRAMIDFIDEQRTSKLEK